MLNMLSHIEENSIDCVITDPPYGLTSITKRFGKEGSAPAKEGKDGSFARLSKGFMGKEWDGSGIEYNVDAWRKCFKALKPGGYLLAFGGSRTFHRIACAIEDAGFELRDTIMYLYGSGFPKSHNIGLAIDKKNGIDSEIIASYERYNEPSGIVNIGQGERQKVIHKVKKASNEWQGYGTALKPAFEPIIMARKPIKTTVAENVMIYGVGGINIDGCRVGDEIIPEQARGNSVVTDFMSGGFTPEHTGRFPANIIHDGSEEAIECMGEASRYFYTAKASKKDRDEGLGGFKQKQTTRKNTHPTVKPCELMQYLIRLVAPKGATILDPFMGSGSTGKAVMFENRERNADYKFIGIDLEKEYCEIAEMRIDYALNKYEYDFKQELQEAKEKGQLNLFDMEENL